MMVLVINDHDGAGAHDHDDPLRCHHSTFKRRTGEDAVSLHDHDGAGDHDHDPLRCHHSTFKRRTVTVRCCKFAAKIHSRGPECSPKTSVQP